MTLEVFFVGDGNQHVKYIQQDMYNAGMLGILYRFASSKYLDAERLLDAKTELGQQIRRSDRIAYSTLHYTHDMIAAWFRFTSADELHPELPGVSRHSDDDTRIRELWRQFFREEVERMSDESSEFLRNVLRAAHFPSPDDRGCVAEENLRLYVREAYDSMYEYRGSEEEAGEYQ